MQLQWFLHFKIKIVYPQHLTCCIFFWCNCASIFYRWPTKGFLPLQHSSSALCSNILVGHVLTRPTSIVIIAFPFLPILLSVLIMNIRKWNAEKKSKHVLDYVRYYQESFFISLHQQKKFYKVWMESLWKSIRPKLARTRETYRWFRNELANK